MALYSKLILTNNSTVAASVSRWVPLDPNIRPFAVAFTVTKTSAVDTVAFSVQHTLHDLQSSAQAGADASAGRAFDHSTVSGKSAAIDGNYAFPIAGIRIILLSGSGTTPGVEFTVRQAGPF